MQIINQNLTVISPGDPFEETYNDMIKIFLSGTLDLVGGENKLPWQQKFINALARIVTEEPQEGMPDLRNLKFLVMNPLAPVNGTPTLDNPEFIQKMQWEYQCYQMSDSIFCNFLRKGVKAASLSGLMLNASSGKIIARCPVDSIFYGQVKLLGQNYGFPVVGDSASALVIIKTMFESNPKLKELVEWDLNAG